MDTYELAKLVNHQVPLGEILDHFGVQRQHHGASWQIQCCFHKADPYTKLGTETKWSARGYTSTNKFWCYAEHKQYTITDIIMHFMECDIRGAVAWATNNYTIDKTKLPPVAENESDPVLDSIEQELRKFRGRVTLDSYRKIAYAITRTKEDELPFMERKTRIDRIKRATKDLTKELNAVSNSELAGTKPAS